MDPMKQSRIAALLALIVAAPLAACSAGVNDDTIVASEGALRALDTEESAFLSLINAYRAQNGLAALTATPLLNQVAYDHSLDLGQNRYFDHNDLQGNSPFARMKNAEYRGGAMAENIAAGNSSAQATFDQWKGSAGHNANMLGAAYRAIGIGRAAVTGSPYTYYWTTDFGDVVDGSQLPGGGGPDASTPDADTPDAGSADEGANDSGAPPAVAQLFTDANYLGRTQALVIGRYPLAQLSVVGNDSVSSLKVPATLKVTLFQNDNFGGTSRVYTGDTWYLGRARNDQASSVVVEAR